MQNEKFTNEQITRYITDWRLSGLSKIKFCKEHQLVYHVFLYWCNKELTSPVQTPAPQFIPIALKTNEDIIISSKSGIQIRQPFNDTTIHILKQLLAC